jgi:hypothetical protein
VAVGRVQINHQPNQFSGTLPLHGLADAIAGKKTKKKGAEIFQE